MTTQDYSQPVVLSDDSRLLDTDAVATANIADDQVTDAKLRNSAALSVIGRSANSTGDPADIAAGSDGQVLRRSGTTLGFGTLATAAYGANTVTLGKLAQIATALFLGRKTASTGDVETLSVDDVLTLLGLDVFIDGTAAKGDMAYYDGSAWVILPAGSTGQVLTVNASGVPEWA